MYCPNCGEKTSTDLRFCRSCGLGLEKIVQSLVEQIPAKLDETLQQRQNRLERLGMIALGVFGSGVLGLLVFGIGYKLMLTHGIVIALLAVLGVIILLGSGLAAVILFANAKEAAEAAGKHRLEREGETTDKRATNDLMLNAGQNENPSVTEGTTEILKTTANK